MNNSASTWTIPTPANTRTYLVLAVDPDAKWRIANLAVVAVSRFDARERARIELARDRRDHWDIEKIIMAAPTGRCEGSRCTDAGTIDSGDFGMLCPRHFAMASDTVGT